MIMKRIHKLEKLHVLTKEQLKTVSKNLCFTHHATGQIKKRLNLDISLPKDKKHLRDLIRTSRFAYVNTDESINISFSETTYLVVGQLSSKYLVITFKEPSHNSYTVKEKYELALKGVER